MTVDGQTKKWWRADTYGGKLTENIVQALCRDIMAEAIVRIEDGPNPYSVLMSVHDELVNEAPVGLADARELEALMSVTPAWADGFPIEAEAWVGPRYRK
jgi:DNA polymerase